MARLSQGILGGISGKIGNVVGSSWKGIAVIKSKPLSVANPRTAGQIAQRNSMATIVDLSTQILADTVKPLWDRFAQKQSGYNAFVQANIANCNSGGIVDPTVFVIAKGKMPSTEINSVVASFASKEAVMYFPVTLDNSFSLATDLAYAVAYSPSTNKMFVNPIKTTRSFGETVVAFDDSLALGSSLVCYLAFKRADGTIVSNTSHEIVNIGA